ncbi:hypothetical protein [Mesorhizobium sp. CAU 1732]|uniref:hypothetical protein n=1 Tax=Mesorhizobium sp. CAU 1732 TaxID=3140358 RepID=UPI0032610371
MDEQTKSIPLRIIMKSLDDVSDGLDGRGHEPAMIREAVKRASATLVECYGAGAVERARQLLKSAEDPLFAKMVLAELERNQRAT